MLPQRITDELTGKRVLVMGLGRFGGGAGAARFLAQAGAKVTVTDQADEKKLADSIAQLSGLPITYHLGGHLEDDFHQADLVVVNPAVKKNNPYLDIARRQGVPLTAEMNLFFTYCPAPIVGITGSNGKSTTTAMIAAVLEAGAGGKARKAYRRVWVGGNIGQENLLSQVGDIQAEDVVVLELSSFMLYDLETIQRSPRVAVVTNIAPNHLDWHGTMEEYVRCKQNILRFQKADDVAILNRLDEPLQSWAGMIPSQVRWYPPDPVTPIELQVVGFHNQVNASAALVVAEIFGVEPAAARQALASYKALEHRIEFVREVKGVRYYNDSIATTPESVMVAIDAFKEPKVFILGGYDKKVSFTALAEHIVLAPLKQHAEPVMAVVLLGQVREQLFAEIEAAKERYQANFPDCVRAETFEDAVAKAAQMAHSGCVVLMSPACASYDMFVNFTQRGRRFREMVGQLA